VKTIMLQAASQRGILTEERLQAALKPSADLHQASAGVLSLLDPRKAVPAPVRRMPPSAALSKRERH